MTDLCRGPLYAYPCKAEPFSPAVHLSSGKPVERQEPQYAWPCALAAL